MENTGTTEIINNVLENTGNPNGGENQKPPVVPSQDSKMALFAKMEKINRAKEAEWKSKEKEFGDLREKLGKYAPLEDKFNKLKDNPWELLKESGWDLEKLAKHAIDNTDEDELDPVTKRLKGSENTIAELKAQIEKLENGMKSKNEEEKNYTQELFNREISSFINGNKEKYEYLSIEETGSDMIKELITSDLVRQQEEGISQEEMKVMDLDEAAALIETKLDEYYSKRLTLNKVQSRFGKPTRTIGEDFSSGTEKGTSNDGENFDRAVNLVKSWRNE